MPFTLDIIPHVPSLDMYGSARSGTAYSLSGEIVLTLTSPTPSLFSAPGSSAPSSSHPNALRPTIIYLSSLVLTFEGRVEVLSYNCGYAPFRLCQVEKELVTASGTGVKKPIVLTNRGVKNGVMRWSMTFDLAVPGWLPPSVSLDEQGSGTSYSMHACAKFADDFETALGAIPCTVVTASSPISTPPTTRPSTPLNSASSATGGVSSFFPNVTLSTFNPFASFTRPKVRQATAAPVTIKVNRFRAPKSLNPFGGAALDLAAPLLPPQIYHPTASLFPVTLESVETRVNVPAQGNKDPEEGKRIPIEYLSGIEIVAGVPEYVGMGEEKVPLSLRVRSTNPESINKGLVLEAFDVEVEQVEKFRSIPCERFLNSYPVPPPSQQPPIKPFLNPNPLEGLYTLGLSAPVDPVQWTRTVPMLPTKRVNFRPSPATGGLEVDNEWAKMDLAIAVLRKGDHEGGSPSLDSNSSTGSSDSEDEKEKERDEEKSGRNLRRKLLNSDFDTPFCKIRHEMKIALRLSWLPESAAEEIAAAFSGPTASASTLGGASIGERMRKARMSHKDRKTETLLMSLPIRLAQVSEGVERIYKTLNVHHGAAAAGLPQMQMLAAPGMRRALAQSRSASPAPSMASSSGSGGLSSTRASPANGLVSLPSVVGGPGLAPVASRSGTPTPPGAFPSTSSSSSHSHSSSSSSSLSINSLTPYAVAVASSFPGPFVLPPYSELYHANGDRKEMPEDSWLPTYVEKDDSYIPSEEQDLGLALRV